jgi:hypothetical protein
MKMLAASAFAVGVGVGVMAMSPSQAMPIYPADKPASSDITLVFGGCGPGWHRGPYGGCRPLYNALRAGIADRMADVALETDFVSGDRTMRRSCLRPLAVG